MVEGLEPRQRAFFPGADGSVTEGYVEILPDGTPNVGRVKRWGELIAAGYLEISNLQKVDAKLRAALTSEELIALGREVDETISSFRQHLDLMEEHLGFSEK